MPRPNLSAGKATLNHGLGARTVTYVNVDGVPMDAKVVGGSGASLNLRVQGLPAASRNKTGIAKRTAFGQTNVWY